MYEMFAFELPWQRGSGDGRAAMNHGLTKPTPLSHYYPSIHPKIEEIIFKCMEPDVNDRIQTISEVLSSIAPLPHEDKD